MVDLKAGSRRIWASGGTSRWSCRKYPYGATSICAWVGCTERVVETKPGEMTSALRNVQIEIEI